MSAEPISRLQEVRMNRRSRWRPSRFFVFSSALAIAGCPDATPNPGTTTGGAEGPVLKGEFVGGRCLEKPAA